MNINPPQCIRLQPQTICNNFLHLFHFALFDIVSFTIPDPGRNHHYERPNYISDQMLYEVWYLYILGFQKCLLWSFFSTS